MDRAREPGAKIGIVAAHAGGLQPLGDGAFDPRIAQQLLCQGVMLRDALALAVGQFKKIDKEPPFELAGDIGLEIETPALQPYGTLITS